MQPQTPSRDRFIANRSAIDLDVARYALDSSTNGNNATNNGDGSSASQPDSLLIASPSKVWKFVDMEFFSLFLFFTFVVFRARARDVSIFSSFLCRFPCFLSRCCGREAFRSLLLLLLLLLHKAIFSIDERFLWLVLGEKCALCKWKKKLKKDV